MSLLYICHGTKSNLVEFQIVQVQSPVGVSSKIYTWKTVELEFLLIESPMYEIWVLPWGPKSDELDRYSNLRDLSIMHCSVYQNLIFVETQHMVERKSN